MRLKKANAVFGLLTILMLTAHVTYQMVSYIKFTYDPKTTMIFAGVISFFLLVHVVLAMCILMFTNERADLTAYPKYNKRTIVQRASAIGILVLLVGHVSATNILMSGAGQKGLIIAVIIQVLFIGMIFAHVATSFSNALVTLGIITSEKTKETVDRVMAVLCSASYIFACVIIIKTYIALLAMGS